MYYAYIIRFFCTKQLFVIKIYLLHISYHESESTPFVQ